MKHPETSFIFLLTAVIILMVTVLPCGAASLRILYVNDFHGFAESHKRIGSDELQGGIAHCAFRAAELRKEKPSLLLAAGDMIQGDTWANLFAGRSSIDVMNEMGFDAMVVGNHEFDFGKAVLARRIEEAKFPVLAANVTGFDPLKPYVIREIDGLKIAIIGVVTEETPSATHPSNVAGLQFLPVTKTVERYVTELRDKVDLIVVLSHIGYNADMALASAVKGIDVIVGGHSHTKAVKEIMVGNTIIVQAYEHVLALGVLDLTVEDGRITSVSDRLENIAPAMVKKDEKVAAIVENYACQVRQSMEKVIGEATLDLNADNARSSESNLGNLVADIIKKESGAEAAIINGGGLRTSILKGPVTVGNIYSVLPFNNYIIAIRLTGQQIKDALEYGLSGIEAKEGRFPQVSGIYFTFSPTRETGRRVGTITIGGGPVELSRQYTVATNDFLAAGGDGYQMFREAIRQASDFEIIGGTIKSSNIAYNDAGRWLRDVVAAEVQKEKKIGSAVEGRIRTEGE
ncbi:MAG: bifunctional UDP-sugar hydrolase/5'-nucleotidase [Syntrophorhabdaceae bacterium]|nr:bifunctional UDP-sugar hydrolase/5'-nucleotidase [Syntrophorhabdaceae bacterium]